MSEEAYVIQTPQANISKTKNLFDLVDMHHLARYKGYRYTLTCIDVFTLKTHAISVKGKAALLSYYNRASSRASASVLLQF